MYAVYIIHSDRKKCYYVGHTENLEQRLKSHNANKTRTTKNGAPWVLVHMEEFIDRLSASDREKQIKSYKGGNAFRALINK